MGLSLQSARVAVYREYVNAYPSMVINNYLSDLCRPPSFISTLVEILNEAEEEVRKARRSLRRSYQRRKNS